MKTFRPQTETLLLCLISLAYLCGCGDMKNSSASLSLPGGVTVFTGPSGSFPTGGNATIKGSVAGTTVIAVDQNNAEIARNVASGSPKSFSLTVPSGKTYRFYFIENEGTSNERLYSLYHGSSNLFTMGSAATIDLGYVDTSSGVATASNNPLNASGVTADGEDRTAPSMLSGSSFSMTDLQGTWSMHMLGKGWAYGSLGIDGSGNALFSSIIRNDRDSSLPSSDSLSISSSGTVTCSGNTSFHALMSKDKNLIVGTMNGATGAYELFVYQKAGSSFSTSDLQGTWNMHMLGSGWALGSLGIDGAGNALFSSISRSNGDPSLPPADSLSISSGGIISSTVNPSFHGVISPDKNLIVGTMTDSGAYRLLLLQKGGGTFGLSDLQGRWNSHQLGAGWAHGSIGMDSAGNAVFSSIKRSDGNSSLPASETLSISPAGIITSAGNISFHGLISNDKGFIAGTMTGSGGASELFIYQK